MKTRAAPLVVLLLLVTAPIGCAKKSDDRATAAHAIKHEHKPPHGGTPVALGDELYHLEFVRDAATGTLQAFVFDGELENFIRSSAPTVDLVVTVNGSPQTLTLKAVANSATGETVGDTALFEAQAGWLKTTGEFDAVLKSITIRDNIFTDVKFNFPKGNEQD
jgi:hypothetical protein